MAEFFFLPPYRQGQRRFISSILLFTPSAIPASLLGNRFSSTMGWFWADIANSSEASYIRGHRVQEVCPPLRLTWYTAAEHTDQWLRQAALDGTTSISMSLSSEKV